MDGNKGSPTCRIRFCGLKGKEELGWDVGAVSANCAGYWGVRASSFQLHGKVLPLFIMFGGGSTAD